MFYYQPNGYKWEIDFETQQVMSVVLRDAYVKHWDGPIITKLMGHVDQSNVCTLQYGLNNDI